MSELWRKYDLTYTIRDVQNNFDYEKKKHEKKVSFCQNMLKVLVLLAKVVTKTVTYFVSMTENIVIK